MCFYKIYKETFFKIVAEIEKRFGATVYVYIPDNIGRGKYYRCAVRQIFIGCRESHQGNYDNELAFLIHEIGHYFQLEVKPELESQLDRGDVTLEKEAWERGWEYILRIEDEIPLNIALFKPKYEEVKKHCLETYYKKHEKKH